MPTSTCAPRFRKHPLLILSALAISLGLLAGCGGPAESPTEVADTATPAPAVAGDPVQEPFPDRPLTGELAGAFGAAHHLPADCLAFSAVFDLDDWALDLWESRAVRSLRTTPAATMGMAALQHEEPMRELQAFLQQPVGQELQALVSQCLDQEVFFAIGADAAPRLQAVNALHNQFSHQMMEVAMGGGGDPDRIAATALIDGLNAHGDGIKVPSVMIGARLADEAQARTLIDQWLPLFASAVPRLQHSAPEQEGPWTHRFALTGAAVMANERERLQRQLLHEGFDESQSATLLDWVAAQTLHVNLGIRDGYLVLHIGADDRLLDAWSQRAALAASEAFRPLRSLYREGLFSVGYQSAELSAMLQWGPERVREMGEYLMAMIPAAPLPPALGQRLRDELPPLIDRVAESVAEPTALAACTFRDQGLRSLAIQEGHSPYLASGQVSLLSALAGDAALLQAHTASSIRGEELDIVSDLSRLAMDFITEFALPQVPPSEREQAQQVLSAVATFGTRVHRHAEEDLLPAFGEAYAGTLVMEEGGALQTPPGIRDLPATIAIPRMALAMRLEDPEALVRGVAGVAAAAESLGREIAQLPGSTIPGDLRIPAPQMEQVGNQTWYRYETPLGADVEPVAVIVDDLLLCGLSPEYLRMLIARRGGDAQQPMAAEVRSRLHIDIAAWAQMLFDSGHAVLQASQAAGSGSSRQRQQQALVVMHVQALVQALQNIDGLQRTVEHRGPYTVTETWLRTAAR